VGKLRAQLAPLIDDKAALDSLSANAADHFRECNELLDGYMPADELLPLPCPLLDVRPERSECNFCTSLASLTSDCLHDRVVRGDHWTMMFGEYAQDVCAAVRPFLDDGDSVSKDHGSN